jgi:rRNA small subunit pseudouridine methyltransferase Nep1
MSASAPVFNPAKPITGQNGDDLEGNTLDGEGEEGESSNAAAIAAAVAKSRVTRPLPNSRRAAPGADFVPKQATVPKSAEQKENTRRLIVVLSQVSCLFCTDRPQVGHDRECNMASSYRRNGY